MKWKLFFIFSCVALLSACQTLPGVLPPTALANTPTIQIESLTSSPTRTPTPQVIRITATPRTAEPTTPPSTPTAVPPMATATAESHIGTILLIFGDRFIHEIYETIRPVFEAAGYEVLVASRSLEPIRAKNVDLRVEVDLLLEDVVVDNYEAIIFTCDNDVTFGSARSETDRIAQASMAQGKVLAAICSGPRILAYAEVVAGRTVTGEPSQTCQMLDNAGGLCTGNRLERDGNIITARDRDASRDFAKSILAAIDEQSISQPVENRGDTVSFEDTRQELGAAQSWDVALGDLDGDGDLDVFVANAIQGGEQNAVWINDGGGTFTLSDQALGYGQGVTLGDIDSDGDLDAVVTGWWGTAHASIWLNDGSGIFADSGQDLGAALRSSLGDLDDDGDLDLYLSRMNANSVYLNDGLGVFSDTDQRLGTAITAAVGLADLDGDGDLDVLAGGWDEAAKVWVNDGTGTFFEHEQHLSAAAVHVHDLALGDVDGDGDLDAFMAVASGDPNQVWINDGSGAFRDSGQPLRSSLAHGVSLGDMDGDGDLDAVTSHGDLYRGSSGGKLWLNDGAGQFENSDIELGDLYCTASALGDLDGDGDLDIFITYGDQSNDNGGGIPNKVWLSTNQKTGKEADMNANVVEIPLANPPTIDGTHAPGEWDAATIETFGDGSELLLMQADGYFYVGIRAIDPGMIAANVFIQHGDEISIMHSSAALGTAIYKKEIDSWQQTQDFTWQCRSTSLSDAAQAERDAFLQEEGWVAANGRMGTPNELEYQIKIPVGDFRLAAVYIQASPPYEKIPWPAELTDDTIMPTPGGLPDTFNFSTEQWAVLDLSK
jgi:putative intracellular protease/amidase